VRRVVLDTNVFVSSVLVKKGLPAQVVQAWRDRRYLLVVSPPLIAEIRRALSYPHIRRKYGIVDDDVTGLACLLENEAAVVPGTAPVAGAIPADPADEIVLACAVDGQADAIVSGDRHLLEMGEYLGIPVLSVRGFLSELSGVCPAGHTPPGPIGVP
jgi:putative PIN family toxin of toxin-antitoxin system